MYCCLYIIAIIVDSEMSCYILDQNNAISVDSPQPGLYDNHRLTPHAQSPLDPFDMGMTLFTKNSIVYLYGIKCEGF